MSAIKLFNILRAYIKMSKFRESRKNIRYHIRFPALIEINGQQYKGNTTNVSLNGAFIHFDSSNSPDVSIAKNNSGLLNITLKHAGNECHFETKCEIKFSVVTGVGIFYETPEAQIVDILRQLFDDVLHLIIDGKLYICTSENRLAKLGDWNEEVGLALAIRENFLMTDQHWAIIKHLREYYQNYQYSPNQPMFLKYLNRQSGFEDFEDAEFYQLFRDGIEREGTRIAGLPEPLEEVTPDEEAVAAGAKSVNAASESEVTMLNFEGREYHFDATGNLIDTQIWNERLAIFIAEEDGISLTQAHWEILHYLRKFYAEYGVVPNVKVLMKQIKNKFNYKIKKEFLYQLFPKGPSRQGSKIAGLPEPLDCID